MKKRLFLFFLLWWTYSSAEEVIKLTNIRASSSEKRNLPVPIKMSQAHLHKRDVVIVIDPGHGGKDPGARGYRGTREKDIVLGISKELQRLLSNTYGFRAVLTRNADYYIGLR